MSALGLMDLVATQKAATTAAAVIVVSVFFLKLRDYSRSVRPETARKRHAPLPLPSDAISPVDNEIPRETMKYKAPIEYDQEVEEKLPVLFVHGNSGCSSSWQLMIWLFESNGYPSHLLRTLQLESPLARLFNSVPGEQNRSSSEEQYAALEAAVAEVLQSCNSDQLILVGHSRGCSAIRRFVKTEGSVKVAKAVLIAGMHNGSWMDSTADNKFADVEFAGNGRFVRELQAMREPVPAVPIVTIRSDNQDICFQKTLMVLAPYFGWYYNYIPSKVSHDLCEIDTATNLVLPGLDHSELAFSAAAFPTIFHSALGREPTCLALTSSSQVKSCTPSVLLNGQLTGFLNQAPTNRAVLGGSVRIWQVEEPSGSRLSPNPDHEKKVCSDGFWGPFQANPQHFYEFELKAQGQCISHFFPPFLRDTNCMHLRLGPPSSMGVKGTFSPSKQSLVLLYHPVGNLAHGRDFMRIDGKQVSGVGSGSVPQIGKYAHRFVGKQQRSVKVQLNGRELNVCSRGVVVANFIGM